jgi:hypothetical protein
MRRSIALFLPLLALTGCVAPTGPVEVTRFHLPDTAMLRGSITVQPAPGMDPASLELRTYQIAVTSELQRVGYREEVAGQGSQVAEVRVERRTYQPERNGSPVSVGVGGSTGSYGSGLGVGIGIDLSGPPPAQVETRLGVMIRDRVTHATLWEGRAAFVVSAKSPLATTDLAAAEMARALFRDFPGRNGETVLVKTTTK